MSWPNVNSISIIENFAIGAEKLFAKESASREGWIYEGIGKLFAWNTTTEESLTSLVPTRNRTKRFDQGFLHST